MEDRIRYTPTALGRWNAEIGRCCEVGLWTPGGPRPSAQARKFTGTVEVVEKDEAAHRALLRVKSREAGGQGHANADVVFQLNDGGGTIQTKAQITGKAASMGEGVVVGVLDALITDFAGKLGEL